MKSMIKRGPHNDLQIRNAPEKIPATWVTIKISAYKEDFNTQKDILLEEITEDYKLFVGINTIWFGLENYDITLEAESTEGVVEDELYTIIAKDDIGTLNATLSIKTNEGEYFIGGREIHFTAAPVSNTTAAINFIDNEGNEVLENTISAVTGNNPDEPNYGKCEVKFKATELGRIRIKAELIAEDDMVMDTSYLYVYIGEHKFEWKPIKFRNPNNPEWSKYVAVYDWPFFGERDSENYEGPAWVEIRLDANLYISVSSLNMNIPITGETVTFEFVSDLSELPGNGTIAPDVSTYAKRYDDPTYSGHINIENDIRENTAITDANGFAYGVYHINWTSQSYISIGLPAADLWIKAKWIRNNGQEYTAYNYIHFDARRYVDNRDTK